MSTAPPFRAAQVTATSAKMNDNWYEREMQVTQQIHFRLDKNDLNKMQHYIK